MSKAEAEQVRIANPRLYFKTYSDKANKVPPADKSDWFKLENVDLCNAPPGESDLVGVVRQWQWPDALAGVSPDDFDKVAAAIRAGRWRESSQARDWSATQSPRRSASMPTTRPIGPGSWPWSRPGSLPAR
jgi:hypothetical protein